MLPDQPAKKPDDVGAAGEGVSANEPDSSVGPVPEGGALPDEQARHRVGEESDPRDQETTPGGDPTPSGSFQGDGEGTSEDQPGIVYCVRCGNGMEAGDRYCHGCGWEADRPLPSPADPTIPNLSGHSRLTAFLLCIVLGWVGAHRFYVGKIGTGILWLCTFGIFSVGIIYDVVLIGTGEFRDFDGRRVYRWQ